MQSQHFIDGQWTATDRWTDSLDPANGELIGRFADGGEAEAEAAVAAAARAFNDPQWAQNPRRARTQRFEVRRIHACVSSYCWSGLPV